MEVKIGWFILAAGVALGLLIVYFRLKYLLGKKEYEFFSAESKHRSSVLVFANLQCYVIIPSFYQTLKNALKETDFRLPDFEVIGIPETSSLSFRVYQQGGRLRHVDIPIYPLKGDFSNKPSLMVRIYLNPDYKGGTVDIFWLFSKQLEEWIPEETIYSSMSLVNGINDIVRTCLEKLNQDKAVTA